MSHDYINLKFSILQLAATHLEHHTDVEQLLKIAKQLEDHIFAGTDLSDKVDSEAAKRAAFLASLDTATHCGKGKEGCDGSEGTCTC